MVDSDVLRSLPSVDEVLRDSRMSDVFSEYPRWAVVEAVRAEVDGLRQALRAGWKPEVPEVRVDPSSLAARLEGLVRPALVPLINATGVVVHTNLGRAPLPPGAIARIGEVAGGYSNLEYDLLKGRRGSRHGHIAHVAGQVWGVDDALVVNNNAAAVLVIVSSLAAGREVIVSRGELVEIGGGFRIPDVIVQGGACLKEVGTTNRTRTADYEQAISESTAALLKVHRSNFDIVGFSAEVSVSDLAALGRRRQLPVVVDLGSGAMLPRYGTGLDGEPLIGETLRQGADVVCFSGDKLLGGPQAGIILGRRELLAQIRQHPLIRALRPGKLNLAALEATLELWRDRRETEIPVVAMLGEDPDLARKRALRYVRRLRRLGPHWETQVQEAPGRAGGGSLPGKTVPGWALALRHRRAGAVQVEAALRKGDPPVVCRIVDDWVLLDLRTVLPGQERALTARLAEVTEGLAQGADGLTDGSPPG